MLYIPIAHETAGSGARSTPIFAGEALENATYSIAVASGYGNTHPTLLSIDIATGIITVVKGNNNDTSVGCYEVVRNSGAGGITSISSKFFYTVSPIGNAVLQTAVDDGIKYFGDTADLNYILTNGIADTSSIFHNKTTFNGNISGLTVYKVTNMRAMFHGAKNFSQNFDDLRIDCTFR